MKTLVLTQNFPPQAGGSGRWFWELYSRLGENYLVVADDVGNTAEFDGQAPFPIFRMPLSSPQWGLLSKDGIGFYWRSYRRLKAFVKEHNITRIHCGRVLPEGLMAWMLAKTTGIPYSCYVHGEDLEASALSRELNSITKMVMRGCRQVICNSHNSAGIVERVDPSVLDKVVVMHPGVDASQFVPAPKDSDFLNQMGWQDKSLILTVGRLQARKGQDKLIEAMPGILANVPNAHYVIIGNGETKERLEQRVSELGLAEHVTMLTQCDDTTMIKAYQQCDVFILPNRTEGQDIEGFGMVLVEAQACAKPVVAGDSGGTKETMIQGTTGFVVDATNTQELTDVLSKLLLDSALREKMGQQARKYVESELDWNRAAEKATTLFG